MLNSNPLTYLPTAEDLPETDFQPVDSELQIWVSALLSILLNWIWRDRTNWFWGVNMGIYYDAKKPAIVPDGFLSLGVDLVREEKGRLSYVLWQENNVIPLLTLEYVSKTYGKEYEQKMLDYAQLKVQYYIIYNPIYWNRDRHNPFEVYMLTNGEYVLQSGEPVWIPELELGIGRAQGTYKNWTREWLYWYDRQGNRLLAPEEEVIRIEQQLVQERQRSEQAEQRLNELLNKLQNRGIDPNSL